MCYADAGAHPPHPLDTGAPFPLVLRAPLPLVLRAPLPLVYSPLVARASRPLGAWRVPRCVRGPPPSGGSAPLPPLPPARACPCGALRSLASLAPLAPLRALPLGRFAPSRAPFACAPCGVARSGFARPPLAYVAGGFRLGCVRALAPFLPPRLPLSPAPHRGRVRSVRAVAPRPAGGSSRGFSPQPTAGG